jgi:hypothetical protein
MRSHPTRLGQVRGRIRIEQGRILLNTYSTNIGSQPEQTEYDSEPDRLKLSPTRSHHVLGRKRIEECRMQFIVDSTNIRPEPGQPAHAPEPDRVTSLPAFPQPDTVQYRFNQHCARTGAARV